MKSVNVSVNPQDVYMSKNENGATVSRQRKVLQLGIAWISLLGLKGYKWGYE